MDYVLAPNVSYDRDSQDVTVGVGQRARWTWTVPNGEVWRILFAIVQNTDTVAHQFFARLTHKGLGHLLDDLPALAAADQGFLLLKTPGNLAGYDRRPGELWVPFGFDIVIRQNDAQITESEMNVTLAFARATSVAGQLVDEATVVLT